VLTSAAPRRVVKEGIGLGVSLVFIQQARTWRKSESKGEKTGTELHEETGTRQGSGLKNTEEHREKTVAGARGRGGLRQSRGGRKGEAPNAAHPKEPWG
jgi:hypothetical protein